MAVLPPPSSLRLLLVALPLLFAPSPARAHPFLAAPPPAPAMALSRSELEALAATDMRQRMPAQALAQALASPPFVALPGLRNCRDLGALEGTALAPGRFYRAAALDEAGKQPEARTWMTRRVSRIFDLRTAFERRQSPSPDFDGIETVAVEGHCLGRPPSMADFAEGDGAAGWRLFFTTMMRTFAISIRPVLEHVRDRPSDPILFHCSAGRDRTGIVAGILHSLAGTPDEVARTDYLLSRIGIEPFHQDFINRAKHSIDLGDDSDTPGLWNFLSLRPSFWAALVRAVDEDFGGWEGYLTLQLAFSAQDVDIIKTNLRNPPSLD